MKRVGIYLRVSTDTQTTDNQRRELEAVAARSGWETVGIYEDAGISGAKGRDKRPGFDRLLKDATARKINMIAAWSVDRLGRSLQDLVGFLNGLQALGCNLYLHQQALDTTTPSGRAMFQMCGVFAELEGGHIVSTSSLDWNVAHAWCGCLKAMPQLINLRLVFGMPQQFTNRLAFANRGAGRLHAQRGLASPRAAHPS